MFGFVMADYRELTPEERKRYNGVYCGVCRRMCGENGSASRFGLQYDMAFLALLHMSLYEPEDLTGKRACYYHPIAPRAWVDNPFVAYSADMNLALAYYKAQDDLQDEKKFLSRKAAKIFAKPMERIRARYPRQCQAMEDCMAELAQLERENCQNPDLPAGCFGKLMAELLVYEEDVWAPALRKMGMALGRFIYLGDAAIDYETDKKKHRYNPFLAKGAEPDFQELEACLVLEMGKVTRYYESLPLVQDKTILDNILYSGIWLEYRKRRKYIDRSL